MCHGSQFLDTIQETSKNVAAFGAAAAVIAVAAVVVVVVVVATTAAAAAAAAAADINELRTVARYQLFDEWSQNFYLEWNLFY